MSLEETAARWRNTEQAAETAEDFEALRTSRRARQVEAAKLEPEVPRVPLNEKTARKMAGLLWHLVDAGVGAFVGEKYALEKDEKEELVDNSVPVIQHYVPEIEGAGIIVDPRALLVVSVAMIYGAKVMAPSNATVDAAPAEPAPKPKPVAPAPPKVADSYSPDDDE